MLISRLSDGVHYAHRAGILHRDLKPSNILLQSNPSERIGKIPYTAKVADFGLAKLETRIDEMMWTPRYPEVIVGEPGA